MYIYYIYKYMNTMSFQTMMLWEWIDMSRTRRYFIYTKHNNVRR